MNINIISSNIITSSNIIIIIISSNIIIINIISSNNNDCDCVDNDLAGFFFSNTFPLLSCSFSLLVRSSVGFGAFTVVDSFSASLSLSTTILLFCQCGIVAVGWFFIGVDWFGVDFLVVGVDWLVVGVDLPLSNLSISSLSCIVTLSLKKIITTNN